MLIARYCGHCGTAAAQDAKFCWSCGQRLRRMAAPLTYRKALSFTAMGLLAGALTAAGAFVAASAGGAVAGLTALALLPPLLGLAASYHWHKDEPWAWLAWAVLVAVLGWGSVVLYVAWWFGHHSLWN
jgi:hypothetical protein